MKRTLFILTLVLGLLGLMAFPAAAQEEEDFGTITVVGSGSVAGSPDIAYVEIGIEALNTDLNTAFTDANTRIDDIISALEGVGIPREDIRTTGLNIYQDRYGNPNPGPADSSTGEPSPTYVVSNVVRVTVRDTSIVADVIDAAVSAGANQLYGLTFGIEDRDALESDARADAFADAQAKAEELAALAGVELGSVIRISEGGSSGGGNFEMARASADSFGGGGAVVEPGQLNVNASLQVTFRING